MSGGEVFLGVLLLANLLLVLLLARKVRLLANRLPGTGQRPWLAPGTQVPPFEATTVDGDLASLARLSGQPSVVGFFSTDCDPCRQQVPVFAEYAAADGGPGRNLAVIVGPGPEAGEFELLLAGKALVVREEQRGPVTAAFSARAFPGIYRLDGAGKVVASGPSVAAVNGAQPAAVNGAQPAAVNGARPDVAAARR
jgi:thiol-disulfide isomerase/thioredoxin